MYRFFESFLSKMKSSFRRIASATKNELTVGDLQNEAWIIAHDIGEKRGHEIDFSDPFDENLVIRAVNHRKVKRGDWKMRRSVRIDEDPDNDDPAIKWADRLSAPASSDPLIALLQCESGINAEAMLASSYSQAAAYVAIFYAFDYDRQEICFYLVLSDSSLMRRVRFAADSVRVQPSLFDHIERISEDFMPSPGQQYIVRDEPHHASTQWAWQF
jgi:hypothetical protein